MRRGGAVVVGLLVVLVATACSAPRSDRPTVTVTASSEPSSPAPVPTATVSVTPSATPARTDPDAPAGQCGDDALSVTVQADPEGGGAGHDDSFVVFRNTGSTACALEGSPGVSLVGHDDGTQLGRAADRVAGAHHPTVSLRPGGYAIAELVYAVVDAHGGIYADGHGGDPECRAEAADGYRVYPPHSFRAVFVRVPSLFACTTQVDWIGVQPVRASITGFTPSF